MKKDVKDVKNQLIEADSSSACFLVCGGVLVVLLISIVGRDMARPFCGLHAWAEASGAWAARSHVNYGLAYTKGQSTWAVGNPPSPTPQRYVDHPQLAVLTLALFMKIFGTTEFAYRLLTVLMSVTTLFIVLKILKALLDTKAALLAALIYTLFPLNGYFGTGGFPDLFGYLAIYCYLAATDRIETQKSKRFYLAILAVSLFLAVQFGWTGFFFAMGIGFDYVLICLFTKKFPKIDTLAVLSVAPLGSLLLNFLIMAAGYGWNINKIIDLYRWRSSKGEMAVFKWYAWFQQMWDHALTNFTLPILIAAILYLTIGQLLVFTQPKSSSLSLKQRRFPALLLFILVPFFQLFLLKGALWRHQIWEFPLCLLVAIAAAQGVLLLGDLIPKMYKKFSACLITIIIAVFVSSCLAGTNHYYYMRWQPEEKIRLFKTLNRSIPPDKALLSFENFLVDQHESKGAFYRPEIAWSLDREIVQATSFEDVQKYAKTGRFPYYLVPVHRDLVALLYQLEQVYKSEYVSGVPGEQTKDGKFLRASMFPYKIFDLRTAKQ